MRHLVIAVFMRLGQSWAIIYLLKIKQLMLTELSIQQLIGYG